MVKENLAPKSICNPEFTCRNAVKAGMSKDGFGETLTHRTGSGFVMRFACIALSLHGKSLAKP
jgi:hypothetical protein